MVLQRWCYLTVAPTSNILYCCPIVEGREQTDDFFIDDTSLTVRGSGTASLQVTFRVDGVALETNETFQLRLTTNPVLPADVFFVDTVNVTIQDPDSKI